LQFKRKFQIPSTKSQTILNDKFQIIKLSKCNCERSEAIRNSPTSPLFKGRLRGIIQIFNIKSPLIPLYKGGNLDGLEIATSPGCPKRPNCHSERSEESVPTNELQIHPACTRTASTSERIHPERTHRERILQSLRSFKNDIIGQPRLLAMTE
jgi:hypothetical protein